MKKVLKCTSAIVMLLFLAFLAYVIYVFVAYHRLPDEMSLEVDKVLPQKNYAGKQSYRIMTYNIGFGAYQPEYSFFMDGGRSSWGKDADSVTAAVCGAGTLMRDADVDFLFVQEVDRDGTRSYHIDELELLNQFTEGYYYTYAQNYDSPFLFFPPLEPHGANRAGIVTYSRAEIVEAIRRSLPISESFSKFVDLDRCYSIARIPLAGADASLEEEKMLCLYNMHMSAYGSSDAIRAGQLSMLYGDMLADYEKGYYVICGGDFNHNLKMDVSQNAPEWAYPFPRESLPSGFRLAIDDDIVMKEEIAHNTCRSAEEAYQEETTYTVTLDGFLISDNVEVISYRHEDTGYQYSDHDPVIMEFRLK